MSDNADLSVTKLWDELSWGRAATSNVAAAGLPFTAGEHIPKHGKITPSGTAGEDYERE